jgi:hypothetical protein
MNENALITSVKGRSEVKGDFNEELAEIQLQEAGYQMRCALACALQSAAWASGLTREEKIALVDAIIQQFADAYTAYFPAYLDMLAEMYGDMETWSAKRLETKSGRKFSAATKQAMQDACAQIKSGHEALLALMDDEADDDESTLDGKAGKSPVTSQPGAARETKSEPDQLHSAAIASQIELLKENFEWTPFNSN